MHGDRTKQKRHYASLTKVAPWFMVSVRGGGEKEKEYVCYGLPSLRFRIIGIYYVKLYYYCCRTKHETTRPMQCTVEGILNWIEQFQLQTRLFIVMSKTCWLKVHHCINQRWSGRSEQPFVFIDLISITSLQPLLGHRTKYCVVQNVWNSQPPGLIISNGSMTL